MLNFICVVITFDLIIEGHSGVGDTLSSHTVEDPARHGEAHDLEDGLHKDKHQKLLNPHYKQIHLLQQS